MRDLLVVVPSRGRPDRLAVMLEAAVRLSEAETDFAVAFDDDDPYRARYEALAATLRDGIAWHTGPRDTVAGWANKVALDAAPGYRALGFLGDDHMPRTPGWDRLLLGAIGGMGGTGFAYGNDLLQFEGLATSVVMSSDIVTALGWMAEPSMRHFYIDNVWMTLGREAGCLAYVPDAVIEHMHPGNGKALPDGTYSDAMGEWSHDEVAHGMWRSERARADVAAVRALCAR